MRMRCDPLRLQVRLVYCIASMLRFIKSTSSFTWCSCTRTMDASFTHSNFTFARNHKEQDKQTRHPNGHQRSTRFISVPTLDTRTRSPSAIQASLARRRPAMCSPQPISQRSDPRAKSHAIASLLNTVHTHAPDTFPLPHRERTLGTLSRTPASTHDSHTHIRCNEALTAL